MKKYVYLISDSNTYNYKIGISNNPERRVKTLQTGNDNKLKIVHKIICEYYSDVEKALHNRYKFNKINGEWFELSNDDVISFPQYCQNIDNNIKIVKNFKFY
jgi:predicted GIY-YIG superfamily endonuclease